MLGTAQKIKKIGYCQSEPHQCARSENDLKQREMIIQLRQRITELEAMIELTREELVRERHHANIDLLTGIPNRRAYEAQLQEERMRCQRDGKPLCLAIWDIDHFKSINDRFGHQSGDKVLKCVAQKITNRLRRSDFTARFGGEEFISLLPDCDTSDAAHLAEQLRKEISNCDHATDLGLVQITISCGIARLYPGENSEAFIARADAALYQAKKQGRDKVCLAS